MENFHFQKKKNAVVHSFFSLWVSKGAKNEVAKT